MTDTAKRKTPADVTPFEREQLRFFLSEGDLAATLNDFNPSLAWLPLLSEMKLIQNETQLTAWIERNFADEDAVRDVVANIRFFGPETANILEYRLNERTPHLTPLLDKCWRLIIRHMRTAKQSLAQNDWFEIAPQLRRGDHSAALFERLTDVLRPKLKISKRLSLYKTEGKPPERPSDLMSIDYEVQDSASSDDVLAALPEDAAPQVEEALLSRLTDALSVTLDDATDIGVESNKGYSTSDTDVPSVARHHQNEYRSGFLIIVRVMAEVWTRLAAKAPAAALAMAKRWQGSPFRLIRRLALFAFADRAVPGEAGANMLVELPAGELFSMNSSVEVYRLIRARWSDFPEAEQNRILERICAGSPRDWFKEGADIDNYIDRERYDMLSTMVQDGIDIRDNAKALLAEINARWPQWKAKPAEQAGFHIWHKNNFDSVGDAADKFKDVGDAELVQHARQVAAAADFMELDSWQRLCLREPDRAERGLSAAAATGDWPPELWEQLLWSQTAYANSGTEARIGQLLLDWPPEDFQPVAAAASSWLGGHAKTLPEGVLWPLWDRIADATLIGDGEATTIKDQGDENE